MALQLKLDPTGVETGAAQAKTALDGIVPTAAKVESALEQIGKTGASSVAPMAQAATAIEQVGVKSALSYMQIQELGHVTRSVAGVMMAGGSALQAFEFEASRIGTILMSGGGPVNAIKAIGGAAAGFLGPVGLGVAAVAALGAAFYEFGPSARQFTDAVDAAKAANDQYAKSFDAIKKDVMDAAALEGDYTEALKTGSADRIRAIKNEATVRLDLLRLDLLDQADAKLVAQRAVTKATQDMTAALKAQADAHYILAQSIATGQSSEDQQAAAKASREATAAVTDQKRALDRVTDDYNLINDQIAVGNDKLTGTQGLLADIASGTNSAADAMSLLAATQPGAGWLDSAISKAQTLAGALWDGVRAADAASVPALRGPAGMGSPPPSEADIRARSFAVVPTISTGGSGGGSAIAAGAKVDLQALVDLSKQIDTTGSAWNAFQSSGGNAIDKLISGTGNLKSALRDMIKEMEIALIKGQLLSHVNGASDSMSIGQLLVKGLFSGWHDAGGTIGMGQTGVVGENGPELVTASSSGAMVTSRVDTARMMGGGQQAVHVTVGVSVDDTGALKAYVKNVAQAAGSQAVQTVKRSLSGWSNQLQTDGALA